MTAVKIQQLVKCRHTGLEVPEGLALIALGPARGREPAAAATLCNALPSHSLEGVCRFDLDSCDGVLSQCLSGHKAAIIVESIASGAATGTISISALSALAEQALPLNFEQGDELRLVNEIRRARLRDHLPGRIVLFSISTPPQPGIEKADVTMVKTMPSFVRQLSLLVSTVLETVKRETWEPGH